MANDFVDGLKLPTSISFDKVTFLSNYWYYDHVGVERKMLIGCQIQTSYFAKEIQDYHF